MKADILRPLSNLLILVGSFILFCVILFWVRSALAAQQFEDNTYLISTVEINPPLPSYTYTATLTPTPTPTFTPQPTETQLPTETPLPTDTPFPSPTPLPTHIPSAGRVVQLIIPRLNIRRAVIYIDVKGNQWDTDSLFANQNRQDLVGQIMTSSNPRDGSNIVLMGHNYNDGWYTGPGVFVNLKSLSPGDQIKVQTESGENFIYIVQKVKQIPWSNKNNAELEKHRKYLWPTENEQLTLVTCGGTNFFTWSHRVYVVALPAGTE